MRFLVVPALLAVALLGACDLAVSEPTSDRRVVGIIVFADDSPDMVIAAPDTVTAGAAFDATITTIGVSGCWRQDGAEIAYAPKLAVVTPYDLVSTRIDGEPLACPGVFLDLPRVVRLVFGQTGAATLRVSGRNVPGEQLSSATPAIVEKQIVVR
jgi:hypothetical protein